MASLKFLIIALLTFVQVHAQDNADTTVYEFVNLYHDGDTFFVKTYLIRNHVSVWQNYYGHTFDKSSIKADNDTFIVHNNQWKKMFNGKTYPFLSKRDFELNQSTIELTHSESPPYLRNHYMPLKKITAGSEVIYVYDMDALHGKHKFYQDTRIYFSFKYGIIGFINYNEQFLMKKFLGKIEMELRPPL